jgi:hypothetical protein
MVTQDPLFASSRVRKQRIDQALPGALLRPMQRRTFAFYRAIAGSAQSAADVGYNSGAFRHRPGELSDGRCPDSLSFPR